MLGAGGGRESRLQPFSFFEAHPMSRMLPRDGYTLPGVFPAQMGIPAMNFKFRFADPKDVYDFQLRKERASNGEDMIEAIKTLVFPKGTSGQLQARISEWDVEEEVPKGGVTEWQIAPCTAENLARLPVPVQYFVANCISRYAAGKQVEADVKN